MNQIERLKTIREEAWNRLEDGRRAIDESPDGKLVEALEVMIAEMEKVQATVAELPDTVDDLELDDLIADLETPLVEETVEQPVTDENYLETPMSVDAYLSQLEAMTVE